MSCDKDIIASVYICFSCSEFAESAFSSHLMHLLPNLFLFAFLIACLLYIGSPFLFFPLFVTIGKILIIISVFSAIHFPSESATLLSIKQTLVADIVLLVLFFRLQSRNTRHSIRFLCICDCFLRTKHLLFHFP